MLSGCNNQFPVFEQPHCFSLNVCPQLKKLENARHEEIATLMEQLNIFYDRLDVPEEQQLGHPTSLTTEVVDTLKQELARLKDLKRQRL